MKGCGDNRIGDGVVIGVEMTDEELKAAVRYWFGRPKGELTCHDEEQQEAVMRLAAERFSENVITGAKARVWLLREEAVPLITEKNLAQLDLQQAENQGLSAAETAALRERWLTLQAKVHEIKVRCMLAETNLRTVTASWLGEMG
jgi:hypothetical protein